MHPDEPPRPPTFELPSFSGAPGTAGASNTFSASQPDPSSPAAAAAAYDAEQAARGRSVPITAAAVLLVLRGIGWAILSVMIGWTLFFSRGRSNLAVVAAWLVVTAFCALNLVGGVRMFRRRGRLLGASAMVFDLLLNALTMVSWVFAAAEVGGLLGGGGLALTPVAFLLGTSIVQIVWVLATTGLETWALVLLFSAKGRAEFQAYEELLRGG